VTADMSFLIDFCIDYRTYLCSLLHNYFKFFNLFKRSVISRSKNKLCITSHHVSRLCLYNCTVYLLDLICPSISKGFQSIFKLLDRTCRLTCILSVKKFSLWSNCMKYKRKVLWTTTKLKDKAIWISYLMYMHFKILKLYKLNRS